MKRFYLPQVFKVPNDYQIPTDEELGTNTYHPETNSQYYLHEVSKYKDPDDFLPFYSSIKQTSDGLFIIATNNFNKCVWNNFLGATYEFNDIISSNTSNLKFKTANKFNVQEMNLLNDTLLLTTSSTGFIELFNTKPGQVHSPEKGNDEFYLLMISKKIVDGVAKCATKLQDSNRFIIGTSKGHLECYEYSPSDLQLIFNIPYGHTDEILGISSHPKVSQFVTCSSDKSCTMWDKRQVFPASSLLKHHSDRLTSVNWLNEELIIIGDSCGNLISLDGRNPKNILNQEKVSNRAIKSLNAKEGKKLGVVSESCVANFYEINENGSPKLIYEHKANPHVIYSMCWSNLKSNTIYIVGDDKYAKEITLKEKE